MHTPITQADFDFTGDGNYKLTASRRMPVNKMAGFSRAELNADGFLQRRQFMMRVELHPLDVRLAISAGVQAWNIHNETSATRDSLLEVEKVRERRLTRVLGRCSTA